VAVKKIFILVLAVMYMGLTSGVMVNIHYCMGQVAGVNYGHPEDEDCGKCGMEKQDGCCHTDQQFVKADGDHLSVNSTATPTFPVEELPLLYLNDVGVDHTSPDPEDSHYQSPPDHRNNDVCLYNCVFRI
jgi:hypothetical protein